MKLGILHHDADGMWSGFRREGGVDANVEVVLNPSFDIFAGTIRPAVGVSVNSQGDTSKAYVDARLEWEFESDLFLAIGIGGAVHTGDLKLKSNDRKALGSRVLLHFPLEFGYRIDDHHGVSVFFDHVSNAWLAAPNEGMDTIGIRWGYKF